MAIHLGVDLRRSSSSLPEDGVGVPLPAFRRASFYLALLRVGFDRRRVTTVGRALLPPDFTLTCAHRRRSVGAIGGMFLCHFPSHRSLLTMRLGVTQHPAHGARTFLPGCKKQPARPSGPRPCSPLATIRTRGANGKLAASHPVILGAPPAIPANAGILPPCHSARSEESTNTPHVPPLYWLHKLGLDER